MMESLREPARRVPIVARAEVVVLGGGPAGIAAAAAAAALGKRTLLVESYGFLGGMGTIASGTNFCGLYVARDGAPLRAVGGIVDEILERLQALDALAQPHEILGKAFGQAYDAAVYRCVLDALLAERGVACQLHALAVGCLVREGRVTALFVETKSGRGAIAGEQFIDASGDADLATWAGVSYEKSSALAFPTMMFRVGNVDDALALREGKPRLRELMGEAERDGAHAFSRRSASIDPQPHAREWRANVTQIARGERAVDGTDAIDRSWGEAEGRRQVLAYFAFLRARVPGFQDAYLLDIAPQLGIRETRRVVGRYQLTRDDLVDCREFDDAIGLCAWPIERHVRGDTEWTFLDGRGFATIPLRALIPREVSNLLVAGRCASATRDAQASIRVSGPCFAMGEAAGTAAALRSDGVREGELAAQTRAALVSRGAILQLPS